MSTQAMTHSATTVATRQETMRAMRQVAYGGAEVLQLGAVARPSPAEDEVLIQVRAAGLDRGTWHLMTGRPYLVRLVSGLLAPKNQVPGLDVAGTVVATGAKVTRFKVGDAVFGIGQSSFAELARAREDKLTHKPARLTFEQAAVVGVSGLTALQSLEAGRLAPGERVLVIGASGGVGTFAVQIAKALGAEVTGVCSAGKAELVRSLGADDVVDYAHSDFADGSRQYDLILDIAGNTPLARLRRALTREGRLVFVGGEQGGDWTSGFERQLMAMALAPFVKQRFIPFMNREHFAGLERLAQLIEAGQVAPAIDRTCPLAQVPQAMRDLEAGRVRGKVAITVSE